ncbi:hypothetical protein HPB50_021115 [Hyalomma asiaticum]|uniref:Uncharacterized protein n=1 Tax=Hyalomma asiaticum TaxID=266040 RepID=A0ACB7TL10_HYAAI|nr:hypothetical protein HPB50_021115 [Hyalomma asiaticum]
MSRGRHGRRLQGPAHQPRSRSAMAPLMVSAGRWLALPAVPSSRQDRLEEPAGLRSAQDSEATTWPVPSLLTTNGEEPRTNTPSVVMSRTAHKEVRETEAREKCEPSVAEKSPPPTRNHTGDRFLKLYRRAVRMRSDAPGVPCRLRVVPEGTGASSSDRKQRMGRPNIHERPAAPFPCLTGSLDPVHSLATWSSL